MIETQNTPTLFGKTDTKLPNGWREDSMLEANQKQTRKATRKAAEAAAPAKEAAAPEKEAAPKGAKDKKNSPARRKGRGGKRKKAQSPPKSPDQKDVIPAYHGASSDESDEELEASPVAAVPPKAKKSKRVGEAQPAAKDATKAAHSGKVAATKAAKPDEKVAKKLPFTEVREALEDPKMVQLANAMSEMAKAQAESTSLLKSKFVSPPLSTTSTTPLTSSSSMTSKSAADSFQFFMDAMNKIVSGMTTSMTSVYDKLNEKSSDNSDFWQKKFEAERAEKQETLEKLTIAKEAAAAAREKVAALESALVQSEGTAKTFRDLYETVRLEKNEVLKKIVDAYAKGWS